MNDILEIQEKLRDTSEALVKLQAEAALYPGQRWFIQSLQSIESRKKKLESALQKAASSCGRAICAYRISVGTDDEPLTLAGMADALGSFQRLLTVIYDAIDSGPKQTSKVSVEATKKSELDFGYAMAGSTIFTFTVPVQSTLFEDPLIERSIQTIFSATKAVRSEEVLAIARGLGTAPVRAMYHWAEVHVKNSLNVDIDWNRDGGDSNHIYVGQATFDRLAKVISETSDDELLEFESTGELVGANTTHKTFHFKPDAGGDITGKSGAVIGPSHEVKLPTRYRVKVRKTTKVMFATGQEKIHYELLKIEPI